MQTNASQNLQCNFISHNNQMNAFCMHFACIWSIVFQRVMTKHKKHQISRGLREKTAIFKVKNKTINCFFLF